MTTYTTLTDVVLRTGLDPVKAVDGKKQEQRVWIHSRRAPSHGLCLGMKGEQGLLQPTLENTQAHQDGYSTLSVGGFLFPEHYGAALALAGVTDGVLVLERAPGKVQAFPYLRESGLTGLVDELISRRCDTGEAPGWRVVKAGLYEKNGARIRASPSDELSITYTARVPGCGEVTTRWRAGDAAATARVAAARPLINTVIMTPARVEQLGGDPDAYLFYDDVHLVNPSQQGEGEFVDHKLQDVLGTLWLLYADLRGDFRVQFSGHAPDLAALSQFQEGSVLLKEKG